MAAILSRPKCVTFFLVKETTFCYGLNVLLPNSAHQQSLELVLQLP